MTIEEFRNFGWKAGMKVADSGLIVAVDFHNQWVIATMLIDGRPAFQTIGYDEILAILNPDGTVAWPMDENTTPCPCCKGSGFVAKSDSDIHDIRPHGFRRFK